MELTLLAAAATLIATYVLLRYGGLWGENDSATFVRAIRSVLLTDRLVGAPGFNVYTNGYGYPALVAFIAHVCNVTLADVQLYIKPLLTGWIVVPAWLAYRELTGSNRGATVATAILLAQPEVLFVILRGTHELFTRGLMLLSLYLLVRSQREPMTPARYTAFVIAFYLAGYAVITSNNLMATSFTAGIGVALALAWTLGRIRPGLAMSRGTLQRLALITVCLFVLSFLFLFYLYPPALHGFLLIDEAWNKASAVILGDGNGTVNPYGTVTTQWIHPGVYLLLSLANWILLIGSAVIWSRWSARWVLGRQRPAREMDVLLWALVGAFAFQGAVSVLVDATGALSSNLQQRLFPSFALAAAPFVGRAIVDWRPSRPLARRLARPGAYVTIAIIAFLSTLKATNEPLLSNKWLFYSPAEIRAVEWAGEYLRYRDVWLEQDERLFAAGRLRTSGRPLGFAEDDGEAEPGTANYLISDITISRSQRSGLPLPISGDDLTTYDNGTVQIYHRRPATPYQP